MLFQRIFGNGNQQVSTRTKAKNGRRPTVSRLRLEPLEYRAMLSASPHASFTAPPQVPPTQYLIIAPEQTNVGKAVHLEVVALDAAGHVDSSYNGTASVADNPTGALLTSTPVSITFHHGEAEFTGTAATAGPATVTATETDTLNTTPIAGSATTTVNAATTATQLVVLTQAHETPGKPVNVTVEALDAAGHIVPTYSGDVTLTGAFSGSPVSYQFSSADGGKHTFTVTFPTGTTGQQTITATDNATTPLTGSVSDNLTSPTTVTHFFVKLPDNVQAGVSTWVTVEALNANNQPVSGYTGTVSFTASAGTTATLPANYTFTTGHSWWKDNGEHTFQVTFAGTGTEGFTVADTSNATLTSTVSTNVYAAPAATQLLVIAPENAPTGRPVNVEVVALDAAGHIVPGYAGALTLSAAPNTGVTITGPATPDTSNTGFQVFQVTFTSTGSEVLTASDTNLTASATTTAVTPPVKGFHGFGGFDD